MAPVIRGRGGVPVEVGRTCRRWKLTRAGDTEVVIGSGSAARIFSRQYPILYGWSLHEPKKLVDTQSMAYMAEIRRQTNESEASGIGSTPSVSLILVGPMFQSRQVLFLSHSPSLRRLR